MKIKVNNKTSNEGLLKAYRRSLITDRKDRQLSPRLSCIHQLMEYLGKDICRMTDDALGVALMKYLDHIKRRHVHWSGDKLRESTIRNYVHYIRGFMLWLGRPIPAQFRPLHVPRRMGRFLDINEIKSVLVSLKQLDLMNRAVVKTLMMTGIRLDELITLTISNVRLEMGLITVMGKGKKERTIPIPAPLKSALSPYMKKRLGRVFKHKVIIRDKNILFVKPCKNSTKMRRLYPRYVERLVASLHHDLHPHALRRTYATWLLYKGVPLPNVSEMLGHARTSTTANIYTIPTKQGRKMIKDISKEIFG
jgi:site-specific recombinase XerD